MTWLHMPSGLYIACDDLIRPHDDISAVQYCTMKLYKGNCDFRMSKLVQNIDNTDNDQAC